MRLKYGKFYAFWRDEHGQKHEKAFLIRKEAMRFQDRMKTEAKLRRLQGIGTTGNLAAVWSEQRTQRMEKRAARELIAAAGRTPVDQLNFMLTNAIVDKWKKKYSRAYTWDLRYCLRRLLQWLVREHKAPGDLVSELSKVPAADPRTVIATKEEIRALLETSAPWFRCLLLLCWLGGFRSGEALRISPRHYEAEISLLTDVKTKGQHRHTVTVHPELQALFAMIPAKADPQVPFAELLFGRPVSRWIMVSEWKKAKKRVGIERRLTMHDLRRTAATYLLEETKDPRHAQQLLGYKDLRTTLRYLAPVAPGLLAPYIDSMYARVIPFKTKKESAG